jgi:hypothetical protein
MLDGPEAVGFTVEVPPEPDRRAHAEAAAIASQRLGNARRDESIRERVYRATVFIMWVLLVVALVSTVAIAVVWLWHLLTPQTAHFLNSDQRRELQNLLIAGIGSSLATKFADGLLEKSKTDKSN